MLVLSDWLSKFEILKYFNEEISHAPVNTLSIELIEICSIGGFALEMKMEPLLIS